MIRDKIEELMRVMREHHEVSAHITPRGICVEVRGTRTVSREYPLVVLEVSRINMLTFELDSMRAEAGSFLPGQDAE